MKEGKANFNPFAGKKRGKEDEGRDEGKRKKRSRRMTGKRMMKGRT
jgi:hypothetical protein